MSTAPTQITVTLIILITTAQITITLINTAQTTTFQTNTQITTTVLLYLSVIFADYICRQ